MLGLLCARTPKPWIHTSLTSFHDHHISLSTQTPSSLHHNRHICHRNPDDQIRRCFHLSSSHHVDVNIVRGGGGVVSVWHPIVSGAAAAHSIDWRDYLLPAFLNQQQQYHKGWRGGGEGSWNVAWDARPARWIHRLDLACLLFGVCAFLSPSVDWSALVNNHVGLAVDGNSDGDNVKDREKVQICEKNAAANEEKDVSVSKEEEEDESSDKYRVTGVPADGRCLFRAIAHGACLRSGEKAPSEEHQRELADELRAKVVDELLKRRKETEWFIEGDFDSYVKRIQQPFVWGGEPELLMASHVLQTPIAVYMRDKSSGDLTIIANYGEEYLKENEIPINVLFHGYGHYDSLETTCSDELKLV